MKILEQLTPQKPVRFAGHLLTHFETGSKPIPSNLKKLEYSSTDNVCIVYFMCGSSLLIPMSNVANLVEKAEEKIEKPPFETPESLIPVIPTNLISTPPEEEISLPTTCPEHLKTVDVPLSEELKENPPIDINKPVKPQKKVITSKRRTPKRSKPKTKRK